MCSAGRRQHLASASLHQRHREGNEERVLQRRHGHRRQLMDAAIQDGRHQTILRVTTEPGKTTRRIGDEIVVQDGRQQAPPVEADAIRAAELAGDCRHGRVEQATLRRRDGVPLQDAQVPVLSRHRHESMWTVAHRGEQLPDVHPPGRRHKRQQVAPHGHPLRDMRQILGLPASFGLGEFDGNLYWWRLATRHLAAAN